MPEYEVIEETVESPEEARIREWFEEQALRSPETLDAGARALTGLVTGLIGVLFGVLTITAESGKAPAYLALGAVRWLGVISVAGLLAALLAALNVMLPRKLWVYTNRPDQQRRVRNQLLERKSRWLTVATAAFAIGLTALATVLVVALLHGTP